MNNNINIDKAWDTLYIRLQEERLLPEEREKSGSRIFPYQRVAAIAILVLACTGLTWWWVGASPESNWITRQNGESSNTLITLLEDGSVAYLAGNASLTYPEKFESGKREVKIEGDVLLDVSRDVNRPFYVETEQATVEVLGTAFRVQSPPGKNFFELSVERGRVRVTQKNTGEQIIVDAGQMVRLSSGYWQKAQMKNPDLLNLYTGKMRFKDERLADIIRVVNTVADRPIVLDEGLADRVLTVTFDEHSAGSMARLICLALNLNCKERQDSIFISR